MKANIHPNYNESVIITCSCGHSFVAGSTKKELKTEICSACHPFYTGQQKLVDTAGRVDKFLAKVKKSQSLKEKKVKKVDDELDRLMDPSERKEENSTKSEEKVKNTEAKKPAAKKTTKKK